MMELKNSYFFVTSVLEIFGVHDQYTFQQKTLYIAQVVVYRVCIHNRSNFRFGGAFFFMMCCLPSDAVIVHTTMNTYTVDIQRHSEGIDKAFLPSKGNFLQNLKAKNVFDIYSRYLLQYSKANAFYKGKFFRICGLYHQ